MYPVRFNNKFDSTNLRVQNAECNRESTVKRLYFRLRLVTPHSQVIAEMNHPRPMGVHSHAANRNRLPTSKKALPDWILQETQEPPCFECSTEKKVKLVQCFQMKKKVNAKAS